MDSNSAAGLLGFWMMLQLILTLAILVGGIYALFCLSRAASGLDRMASALEEWVQTQQANATPSLPGNPAGLSFSQRVNPVPAVQPPVAAPGAVHAQPFSPGAAPSPGQPDISLPPTSRSDELAS